ncbi:MAG: hypothetical protein ABSG89_04340 [Bacteroidales bacterium]
MKKCIFIFTLGIFSLGTLANPKLASKQQIGMFINSKTCVVLENANLSYNILIKDAVQNYWKLTGYEFIDQQEFEKRRFDSRYSFLVLMTGVYDKDPGGVSYNYISLVLGDPANDMTKMPELCSIPLSYTNDNISDYEYVIPAMVKFMQKHVINLETKRFIISIRGLKYYNGSDGFEDKELLFNKDMMASDADSPEKIKTVYPYYVKLITPSEIQEEIEAKPKNVLFHFHVGPNKNAGAGKCFEMIFDVEGNLYFYNSRKITNDNEDGFNLKDFKHLR